MPTLYTLLFSKEANASNPMNATCRQEVSTHANFIYPPAVWRRMPATLYNLYSEQGILHEEVIHVITEELRRR
jgi:hypothetical protein